MRGECCFKYVTNSDLNKDVQVEVTGTMIRQQQQQQEQQQEQQVPAVIAVHAERHVYPPAAS